MPSAREIVKRHVDHPGRGGCGVGAIADLHGRASHDLVQQALAALGCLEHRGGAIEETGDGAGLQLATDRAFFARFLAPGRRLPDEHALIVGVLFFPRGETENLPHWQREIDAILRRNGLAPLGWRHVPVDDSTLGVHARETRRDVWQVLVGEGMVPREDLPLVLFRVKAALEARIHDLYIVSLSARTLVYKALATGEQLKRFYPDLADPALTTSTILFHRRYSTNTFSNWTLAQVFRVLGHNGEINTIKANRNAVANLESELGLSSVLMPQGSDSADMDRIVELFASNGIPLPEAIARIMPMAWRDIPDIKPEAMRWFQAVQRALGSLGAWEGPAAIVASDGRWLVGALDRMGLRPLRWTITRSGRLILGSEVGAVPVPFEDVEEVGQLDPGEILAVDLDRREVLRPAQALARIVAHSKINAGDLTAKGIHLLGRRPDEALPQETGARDHLALNVFGWTWERAKSARHMAENGKEPITSMGNDRPLAVLSHLRPPLTKYFKQIVAVVTNPPIDPIREEGAFDLTVHLGASPTISEGSRVYEPFPGWRLPSPIVTEEQLWLMCENGAVGRPRALVIDATFADPAAATNAPSAVLGAKAIARRIAEIGREAVAALENGEASILVLSDRDAVRGPANRLPLPMVLATSALHNALVEAGVRRRASIVVDTGEIQEGHDVAVFVANGATAVCPWLFYRVGGESGPTKNMVAALEEMLRRVMSKMGICSADGYRGSRLFEAVGIAPSIADHYLPGVTSRLGGLELEDIYEDLVARRAQGDRPQRESEPGVYRKAVWQELQTTARGHDPESYGRFLSLVEAAPPVYLRDLLRFKPVASSLPVHDVAGEEEIVRAVLRGAAMSHGALHRVAHRAIAAAFNELGSYSNCGEGGEDPRRDRGGPWEASRSRIRQVASGRFGVDARYLVHAEEIQIKIGQGAKPGEGGMLPAAKVTAEVAMIRKTQPGVTLISPPPHHDIYSIEDLAQLIYDLRQTNPQARISVKIPAVTDIGTIAVGIAKAGADVIDIAGFEGGTGAASSSSIEHAGLPLERALSEVHQALTIHGIRERVRLRADGGIKTGYDVAAVLALGADEISL
ncbi:MAG TPA: glutamate synthase-related protein, partial [bacterium]|nr:glutamate synthase-related protein [bacterium]